MVDKKYWDFLTEKKFTFSERGYDDFSDELKLVKEEEKKEEVIKENTEFNIGEDLVKEFRKKYK